MEIQHIGTSGVSDEALQANISRLSAYRDELKTVRKESAYNTPESLLRLPEDEDIAAKLAAVAEKINKDNLTDVIVIGMGGSVRGTNAVYNLLAEESKARLHVIDTLSSQHIGRVVSAVTSEAQSPEQLVICAVSKSGETVETLANFNVLLGELEAHFPDTDLKERTVVVSQPGSELAKEVADSELMISIPEQVSGRFSVLSAAGLLPLYLAGVDTNSLRSGAGSMLEACLSGRATADPAAALAAILYFHIEDNVRILNHCFFNPEAKSFGSWIEQLYAESLGKRENRRGEPVFSGLYPVTTIAPDDLHADLQLQLAGPKNFFTIFLETQQPSGDMESVVGSKLLPEALKKLEGKTLADIQNALSKATRKSFSAAGRPFVSVSIDRFSPERVGQLIILEELIVMYLANLLEVNAFNQPQIAEYKKELHKLLEL